MPRLPAILMALVLPFAGAGAQEKSAKPKFAPAPKTGSFGIVVAPAKPFAIEAGKPGARELAIANQRRPARRNEPTVYYEYDDDNPRPATPSRTVGGPQGLPPPGYPGGPPPGYSGGQPPRPGPPPGSGDGWGPPPGARQPQG